jgi:Protein of unknown function (DUF1569)
MLNTRKVTDRRPLRFESLDDALRDAELLAEAEQRGTLRAVGNWSLGQAIGHLAFWVQTPFDGYPGMTPPPWFIRTVARWFESSFLDKKLPAGGRIPRVPEGTYGVERLETPAALAQLRTAYARLANESPAAPNIMFGPMTHDQWLKLNLRHAELHLSFFHPQ